ncbi:MULTISPECIES: hypothetical protein [unclassified Serratia (in: enterobacteria)]|uniref:hypothetical protein n=1 Tax=unclassified Serratia (in: enterobacteria) TaxID=2647522 RepID=UPI0030767310
MNNDAVSPLNYTQEALEHLDDMERAIYRSAPYSAHVIRNFADMLKDSPKFILTNCAEFIAPEEMRQTHLDLARLPYPVVTFEIPWVKEAALEHYTDFPTRLSTKRIALCWELNAAFEPVPGCNKVSHLYPGGGVFIVPIYWTDHDQRWHPCYGGTFFPHDNTMNKGSNFENRPPASHIALDAIKEAGLIKKGQNRHYRAEPFITLPEIAHQAELMMGSREKLFADIILNTRDELYAFIGACSILNCANVTIETLRPKDFAAKPVKGKKKPVGSKPRFTYKILQISDEKNTYAGHDRSSTPGIPSKRMHLRRGHIRRLAERLIWVRPAIINAGSHTGSVAKDYQVSTRLK